MEVDSSIICTSQISSILLREYDKEKAIDEEDSSVLFDFEMMVIAYVKELNKLIQTSKIEQIRITMAKLSEYICSLEKIPFSQRIIDEGFLDILHQLIDSDPDNFTIISSILTSLTSNSEYLSIFIRNDIISFILNHEITCEFDVADIATVVSNLIRHNQNCELITNEFILHLLDLCHNVKDERSTHAISVMIFSMCKYDNNFGFLDKYLPNIMSLIEFLFDNFELSNEFIFVGLYLIEISNQTSILSDNLINYIRHYKSKYPGIVYWIMSMLIEKNSFNIAIFEQDIDKTDQIFENDESSRDSILLFINSFITTGFPCKLTNRSLNFIIETYNTMNTTRKVISLILITSALSKCKFDIFEGIDFNSLFEILSDFNTLFDNGVIHSNSDLHQIFNSIKQNTHDWPIPVEELFESHDINELLLDYPVQDQ